MKCRFFVLFFLSNVSEDYIRHNRERNYQKMKTKTIAILLLAILLLFAAACDYLGSTSGRQPQGQAQGQTPGANATNDRTDAQDIGEGRTMFIFEVTDDDGDVSVWNVHTNETTVGAALIEVGLIDGNLSDFGLMVTHVNGLRADFTEDGAWWAFFIDGEMAMAGVDATDIKEGASYAFVYTPA